MCLSSRDARTKCSFRVEGVDERFPTEFYVFLTVLTKMSSGFKDNLRFTGAENETTF